MSERASTCVEIEGLLPLFTGGDLEPEQRESVALHLDDCAGCAARAGAAGKAREVLRASLAAVASLAEPRPDAWPSLRQALARAGLLAGTPSARALPPRRSALRRVGAWGAGLVAAAGLLFFALFELGSPEPAPNFGIADVGPGPAPVVPVAGFAAAQGGLHRAQPGDPRLRDEARVLLIPLGGRVAPAAEGPIVPAHNYR